MKLMTHTSLFWMTIGMILFFLLGVAFYRVFKELSEDRLKKELAAEMQQVLADPEGFLRDFDRMKDFLDFVAVDTLDHYPGELVEYHDSVMLKPGSGMPDPALCIHFITRVNDTGMHFHICKSTLSSDRLTERITLLIAIMALLFALGLYLLNRHVFTRTWRGFYQTLHSIKEFRAGDPVPEFQPNEIDEFDSLNQEVERMASRISKDYQNLQSFASHAAHEFLTPIAVIRSKAELLLQSERLGEKEVARVSEIIQYSGHLSRVIQALSLLFKMDNDQYPECAEVSFAGMIRSREADIRDQCEIMNLSLETAYRGDLQVRMNPELAGVLVTNLINNAIRHNMPGGSLHMTLTDHELICRNTGKNEALDAGAIFREFYKGDHSGGLGLGLTIVRKIAEQYGLQASYSFLKGQHVFMISK